MYLLKIIDSFLSGRRFRVTIGNSTSNFRDMTVGVPQGSVLSPTFFNVYVSDIPVPREVMLAQFAADSAYLTASHRTSTIQNRLQSVGDKVVRYFNGLGVRVSGPKSAAMIFTRKLAERHQPTRNLTIDGVEVLWTDTVKYLGMRLDRRLTFANHVQGLIERSEKAIRSLYPLINRRSRVHASSRVLLFKTVYRPTFTYGAPIIAHCAATHKKRLQVHQNRILKMMLNKPRRYSTTKLHDLTQVDVVHTRGE